MMARYQVDGFVKYVVQTNFACCRIESLEDSFVVIYHQGMMMSGIHLFSRDGDMS